MPIAFFFNISRSISASFLLSFQVLNASVLAFAFTLPLTGKLPSNLHTLFAIYITEAVTPNSLANSDIFVLSNSIERFSLFSVINFTRLFHKLKWIFILIFMLS
jgi:hypothetical protein